MTVTIVKGLASRFDQQSLSKTNQNAQSSGQSGVTSAVSGQIAASDAAVVKFSRAGEVSGDKIREPGKAKQVAEDIADRVSELEEDQAHNLSGVDSRGHLGSA